MKLKYFFHRDHFLVVASAFVQLFVLYTIAFNINFLNPIAIALEDFSITDIFFDIQHSVSEPETNDLITLVDMTELSSRVEIASLLKEINQCEPLFIGVDLIFEGEKDDKFGNEILKESVVELCENSVFSKKLTEYNSSKGFFTKSIQSFFVREVEVTEAYTNLNDDFSGTCIRDFSISQNLNKTSVLSFPAQIASTFDSSVLELKREDYLINFKNIEFPVVMYNEIDEKKDLINGHIVLIGTMTEEQDMHNTPLGKMSGLKLQAFSLLTLLEHKNIREAPSWLVWIIALAVCYFLEISIDILFQITNRNTKSMLLVFLRESNIITIVLLFMWATFICWLLFTVFIHYCISIPSGIILCLMALICEGRYLLSAIVKSLEVKYRQCIFVKNSILRGKR